MTKTPSAAALQFEALEAMDAPSWESFYHGILAGLGLVGIGVIAT